MQGGDTEISSGPLSEPVNLLDQFAGLPREHQLRLLQSLGAPTPTPTTVTTPVAKPEKIPWPKWNGSAEDFNGYLFRLQGKVEEDLPRLGSSRAICLSMVDTLPEDKRSRVMYFFERQPYNPSWRGLLEHFRDTFEDKQARQAAGEDLACMRQGEAQLFTDFLQDFEYKLAQCQGLGWSDSSKIIHINAAINTSLRTRLVSVYDLPEDDYNEWVRIVKLVAGRLESLPGYRSPGSTRTKTWYARGRTAGARVETNTNPRLDHDGDTIMTGINGLQALIAAEVAKVVRTNTAPTVPMNSATTLGPAKPRAKWVDDAEIQRRRIAGRCFRCNQAGHGSQTCPYFRPPVRPRPAVNTMSSPNPASVPVIPAPEEEMGSEN